MVDHDQSVRSSYNSHFAAGKEQDLNNQLMLPPTPRDTQGIVNARETAHLARTASVALQTLFY